MFKHKYEINFMIFYDFENIEKRLEKMAKKGYLLEKSNGFLRKYSRCEPQDVKYTVTYFHEASEFNPYPTDNQQLFIDYCEDSGWEFVTQFAQMQIFRSTKPNVIPIETDENFKLKAIHRSIKRNYLPSTILLILLAIFQISIWFSSFLNSPAEQLANITFMMNLYFQTLIFVLSISNFLGYVLWYFKNKSNIENGGSVRGAPVIAKVNIIFGVLALIGAVVWLWFLSSPLIVLVGAIPVILIFIIAHLAKLIFKCIGLSGGVSRALFFIVILISSFTLTGLVAFIAVSSDIFGTESENVRAVTSTNSDGEEYEFVIQNDEIPFKLEEIIDTDYDYYSYRVVREQSSPLAQTKIYSQFASITTSSESIPEVTYSIAKTNISAFYDLIKSSFMELPDYPDDVPTEFREYYEQINLPQANGAEIYQEFDGKENPTERYVLCFDNSVVSIRFFNYEVSDEELLEVVTLFKHITDRHSDVIL